jgi:hypothetical protein
MPIRAHLFRPKGQQARIDQKRDQRFPGDEYRERHEAVGCWITYEGLDDEEAAAIRKEARDLYVARPSPVPRSQLYAG